MLHRFIDDVLFVPVHWVILHTCPKGSDVNDLDMNSQVIKIRDIMARHIFISYSKDDREFSLKLANDLDMAPKI